LRAPLAAGSVVSVGGPPAAGSGGAAQHSRGATVAKLSRPAWLFYEDLAPFQQYMHPGRVALVDVGTGRVTLSGTLKWPPAVNGRLPAFLSTIRAYDSALYRVF